MPSLLQFKIAQNFIYQGDDWWKWSIWLEGPDSSLDKVDHVVYTLHPSFPNPVRKISERKTKFRLETAGWGIFTIFAKVVLKNGEAIKLNHNLELRYSDGSLTAL